jgi:FKBP-type peptidyl-prolyl cis-trans isomerase (trigger factor)
METSTGRFVDIAKSFTLTNLPDSEVELTGDVPYEAVKSYRDHALRHIAEHLELPGFRPGKVPPEMALKKVGELAVLEEAVELFVKDFYPELVVERELEAVGRPDIRVTKLAEGNPVGLVIRTTVYPAIEAPKGWKQLHEKMPLEPALPATQEEVDKTLEDVRRSKSAPSVAGAEGALLDAEGKPVPPPLPELNDEFAKSLGAFETLDALKEQIRKGITEEKSRAARDTRRGKLIEALLGQANIAVPRVFVDSELQKIMAQMNEDVQRFGMTFDAYLKQVGKTEQDIRNDFKEQATKRAKLQLLLNKLAEEEKVVADPGAVELELKHALEHFPDANPELVKVHVETVLRNEQVLKLLEGEVAGKTVEA